MCRPRLWVKIIKYWVTSGRKDDIVIRLPLNYLLFPLSGGKAANGLRIQLGCAKSFNPEAVYAALIADTPVPQSELDKIEWVMQHQTMLPTAMSRCTGWGRQR